MAIVIIVVVINTRPVLLLAVMPRAQVAIDVDGRVPEGRSSCFIIIIIISSSSSIIIMIDIISIIGIIGMIMFMNIISLIIAFMIVVAVAITIVVAIAIISSGRHSDFVGPGKGPSRLRKELRRRSPGGVLHDLCVICLFVVICLIVLFTCLYLSYCAFICWGGVPHDSRSPHAKGKGQGSGARRQNPSHCLKTSMLMMKLAALGPSRS